MKEIGESGIGPCKLMGELDLETGETIKITYMSKEYMDEYIAEQANTWDYQKRFRILKVKNEEILHA